MTTSATSGGKSFTGALALPAENHPDPVAELRARFLSATTKLDSDRPSHRLDWSSIIQNDYREWIEGMSRANEQAAKMAASRRRRRQPAFSPA